MEFSLNHLIGCNTKEVKVLAGLITVSLSLKYLTLFVLLRFTSWAP